MPVFGDFDFETFLTTITHNLLFLFAVLKVVFASPYVLAREYIFNPVIDFFKNLFS